MSNFKAEKTALQARVAELMTGNTVLFHTNVGGDELWQWFIDSLPAELRAEYTCNACRSFIKHFGGLVTIDQTNHVQSMWDFEGQHEFVKVNKVLSDIVHAAKIRDVYVPSELNTTKQLGLGLNSNVAQVLGEDGKSVIGTTTWEHLYIQLPSTYKYPRTNSPEAKQNGLRDNKLVLQTSFNKISLDAIQTINDLIGQNSLYRGEENRHAVVKFGELKAVYDQLATAKEKDNFCWKQAVSDTAESVLRFKNTSIGTLAVDISEGMMDLDGAVRSFEAKVAPANYKRPSAVVTPRMIQDAQKTAQELGIESALERRMAVPEDLNVTNALFVDRTKVVNGKLGGGGAFAAMADSMITVVNPKSFSKMEQISLADFVKNVLPTAQGLEFLLENRHEPQMVSLIAGQHEDAANLFKWSNDKSWSYNKAMADGIKERVKELGGNVIADARVTLQWNEDGQSIADLDLHAYEVAGERIYFGASCVGQGVNARRTAQTGNLDIDMRSPRGVGIENITWTNHKKMKTGTVRVEVHNFNNGRISGFRIQVEVLGEVFNFSYDRNLTGTTHVADIHYDGNKFTVTAGKSMTGNGSEVKSKEFWGLKTYSFVPVSAVTYSPNYWGTDWSGTGNRHVFFFLQGAKNEGLVRGFFNEMLDSRLDKHRKVFEVLAGKLQVQPAEEELSGVGFATTGDHEFIVKVKSANGTFERTLRVVA